MKRYRIVPLHEGCYHCVENGETEAPLLTKYGIIKNTTHKPEKILLFDKTNAKISDSAFVFQFNDKSLTLEVIPNTKGYQLDITIDEHERLFGLGDVSRNSIEKRGLKTELWIKNVNSYGPIPFLMSDKGWGLFINTTYKIVCDVDSHNNGHIHFTVTGGSLDIYLFFSPTLKGLINLFTDITGKPVLLPKSGYGLTFVCNEDENIRDILHDAARFRQEKIPCDTLGLEPGWMENYYDFSTNKKWHPTRFRMPEWKPENFYDQWSFIFNFKQMGFKLSLWLCCDYDLLWEEEKSYKKSESYAWENASINDEHLGYDSLMDKITVPGEPWFAHLVKFVQQGVSVFKLDGANQVLEHPDRLWGGLYLDEVVHNIYPVLLAKQMKNGYENETQKRAMLYTPAAFVGIQQYAATWAGDTGGGPDTLVSLLNYAMCGHSNTSCDVGLHSLETMHYGFLIAWTQVLTWRNWHHPWLLGKTLCNAVRDYSRLRSSLFPYIYSYAHIASQTGLAIVRPLALQFEGTNRFDKTNNLFMLGDFFLVGAFDMQLMLPPGRWTDYFTDKVYTGNVSYLPPSGKGGALLVREGSIIVTREPTDYITENDPETYFVALYPGEACSFSLYEDDGETYAYTQGSFAITEMAMNTYLGNELIFTVKMRSGSFCNMPEVTDFAVTVHSIAKPNSLSLNNHTSDFLYDAERQLLSFVIPAALHKETDVICQIDV